MVGLPFSIYEPQITFDTASLVFTYKIKADFSDWTPTASGIAYTAEKAGTLATATGTATATAQSIEALILYYGSEDIGLFYGTPSSVVKDNTYPLAATKENAPIGPYVIVPLDTDLIKIGLRKSVPAGSASTTPVPVVWMEENSAIGELYKPAFDDPYGAGTFTTGYSLGGGTLAAEGTISVNQTNIVDFADGAGSRSVSIATILKEGETSKITFYTGDAATGLIASINNESGGSLNTGSVATWMSRHKPALRVEYKWAD
jgi:hypothetical protein